MCSEAGSRQCLLRLLTPRVISIPPPYSRLCACCSLIFHRLRSRLASLTDTAIWCTQDRIQVSRDPQWEASVVLRTAHIATTTARATHCVFCTPFPPPRQTRPRHPLRPRPVLLPVRYQWGNPRKRVQAAMNLVASAEITPSLMSAPRRGAR